MEDSRNIIKAIDALTLKAGGEVVDSKNITEAIDHLKEVFNQEAIGIDDTLTQEGLAADAKAVGDKVASTYGTYTPTFTGNTGLDVQYVSFNYFIFGKLLYITGRFNIANRGSDDANLLKFTLPPGKSAVSSGAGPCGFIIPDASITDASKYQYMSIRFDGTDPYVQYGAGLASMPHLQAGYHMIWAMFFLK